MKHALLPIAVGLVVLMGTSCGKTPEAKPADQTRDARREARTAGRDAAKTAGETKQGPLTIGVMPKLIGIDFFNATEKGAKLAGQELGVEVVFDGPVTNDVQLQAQMLETWIARKYDGIAIAPNDPDAIAPVLEKARKRGIKVISWDADSKPSSRDFFVNQCTSRSVAKTLMDVMAEGVGLNAKYLILTGSLTAANQNIWMAEMEKYRQEKYPGMTNLSETPKASEEDQALATQVTTDCLKTYADLQGMFAITSVALPGAAEGLRKAGAAARVFLTGLSTPKTMREYVHDGTVKRFVLWNPVDLGYLAVYAAVATAKGELQPGAASFTAGHVGACRVEGDMIILGDPIIFDKSNIDNFDF